MFQSISINCIIYPIRFDHFDDEYVSDLDEQLLVVEETYISNWEDAMLVYADEEFNYTPITD